LVQARFGHAGGAADFFRRCADDPAEDRSYLLASHPSPEARINHINKRISTHGYPLRQTQLLADDLTSVLKPRSK
jgi:hypothetical protein